MGLLKKLLGKRERVTADQLAQILNFGASTTMRTLIDQLKANGFDRPDDGVYANKLMLFGMLPFQLGIVKHLDMPTGTRVGRAMIQRHVDIVFDSGLTASGATKEAVYEYCSAFLEKYTVKLTSFRDRAEFMKLGLDISEELVGAPHPMVGLTVKTILTAVMANIEQLFDQHEVIN